MGLLIWLAISILCLVVFLIVNRWTEWITADSYDSGLEKMMLMLFCLIWPVGIIIFTCMLGAKLIERFLP